MRARSLSFDLISITATILLVMCGCTKAGPVETFELYREAVRAKMLNPDAAKFKDERVRTLWSEKGSRIKIYCASVNGQNAYGGMTGYGLVQYYIFVKFSPESNDRVRATGKLYVDSSNEIDANYYLMCVRPDTQRTEDEMRLLMLPLTSAGSGAEEFQAVDKLHPVISNRLAPELR